MYILPSFKAINYWKHPKLTALTVLSVTNRLPARASKKCPVSFTGTQWKFLLSCCLPAIEWWFDSSLCRSLCCPFTQCNWNILSSYISFSLRYRRKLSEGCRGFVREGASFCHSLSLLLPCHTPHAGLGNTVGAPCGAGGRRGCCCSQRDPSCRHTAGEYTGSRNVVNFTMKNLSSTEQLAGLKGRFRLPYSTSLIRLSI